MAGEFGYKHSDISRKIAHNSLDAYMSKVGSEDLIVANGFSCREQILDVFNIKSTHLAHLFFKSIER